MSLQACESKPVVSTSHSTAMTATSTTPRAAMRLSASLSRMSRQAAKPITRPMRIPVSLAQTGIWEPFRIRLLDSS